MTPENKKATGWGSEVALDKYDGVNFTDDRKNLQFILEKNTSEDKNLQICVTSKSVKNKSEPETLLKEIIPWNDPVDLNSLLTEISRTIERFIVCPVESTHAGALWIAMTWVIDAIKVAPLAIITSPEKRCGKTLFLSLLGKLVNRPLIASNITPAALFRTIDVLKPTLLIDEADTFIQKSEELRGLLNCGHTRESAYTVRLVGDSYTPKAFCVWGPKALAGIGKLPDTLMDRSIILKLKRKLPDEKVDRFRDADSQLFENLRSKLARFSQDYAEKIAQCYPKLPSALNDRAQDNWEPLLAIASIAGGEWPHLAEIAALKLSETQKQYKNVSIELLADSRDIFERRNIDRISSQDLIDLLCKDEEKIWATYNEGYYPIKPRQIATLLKEFGIISNTIRIGDKTAKGYMRLQFVDTFDRYLPAVTSLENVTESQTNLVEEF